MDSSSTMFASFFKAQPMSVYQTCFNDTQCIEQDFQLHDELLHIESLNAPSSSFCNSSTSKENSEYIAVVENINNQGNSAMDEGTAEKYSSVLTHGPTLPSIAEHGGEGSPVSQVSLNNWMEKNPGFVTHPSHSVLNKLINSEPEVSKYSSLPAAFFSRLATESTSQQPHPPSCQTEAANNPDIHMWLSERLLQSGQAANSSEVSNFHWHPLLRQSSSPAGLLSQWSCDKDMGDGLPALGMIKRKEFELINGQGLINYTSADSMLHNSRRGMEGKEKFFKVKAELDPLCISKQKDGDRIPNFGLPTPRSFLARNVAVDTSVCKSRAKRGCATHPRSIAERVRRTKISERMKRLYDLLPNLDKQGHTADMLDEVVEYVKLLQHQLKKLSESSCGCGGGRCQEDEKND